jgi:hypothetical protein
MLLTFSISLAGVDGPWPLLAHAHIKLSKTAIPPQNMLSLCVSILPLVGTCTHQASKTATLPQNML